MKKWDPLKGSLHINISFEEPLTGEAAERQPNEKALYRSYWSFPDSIQKARPEFSNKTDIKPAVKRRSLSAVWEKDLKKFLSLSQKPLILIGELNNAEAMQSQELLQSFKGLVYADPLSQLKPLKGALKSGEKILSCGVKTGALDGVLRIGGLPRVRFWRDLERLPLPVLSLAAAPFLKGLSRQSTLHSFSLEKLESALSKISMPHPRLKDLDRSRARALARLLKKFPHSEPAWINRLQESLPEKTKVFLGNSLPIRLWDQTFLFCRKKFEITGQNGVNGIDGLISRFLGEIPRSGPPPSVAILGDLSALSDFQALWAAGSGKADWRIFIINNFGGRIFSQVLPSLPSLVNPHRLSFQPFAKMWGLSYKRLALRSSAVSLETDAKIIEIQPRLYETEKFFQSCSKLWSQDG